jgi:hypothetical protein
MLCVPLRRVRAGEVRCEEFLYELKAGLRAAACGGRPRAGKLPRLDYFVGGTRVQICSSPQYFGEYVRHRYTSHGRTRDSVLTFISWTDSPHHIIF